MPACRLYLITPPRTDADFADTLAQTLDAGDVACLLLDTATANPDDIGTTIDALRPLAQSRDVAFLLTDDYRLAADTDCDGVHLTDEDGPYGQAREALGADAIIGISCQDSRHLAMEAAERGADYVAFGDTGNPADPVIIDMWNDVTTVPAVAFAENTVDACLPLIQAGADFLAVGPGIWQNPAGPVAAIEEFIAAIASAKAS